MRQQIQIKSCWTDAPSTQLKQDFICLANTVFGPYVTEDYFKTKFENDIYGPSLLTVVYVDGQAAGADMMWRNDLGGVRAYQTVDTCVLKQFRGMGLFWRITHCEMEQLGKDTLVYGFPNAKSYPCYVKMGWHEKPLYKTLCLPLHAETIENEYASWWIKAQQGIGHIQKLGKYYLIRKKEESAVATLLGCVDENTARLFPRSEGVCLFKRLKTKSSIYNKNKSIPLVCNQKWKIPYWKIDAI